MSLDNIVVTPWKDHSIPRPGCVWEAAAKSIIDEQIQRELAEKKIQEAQRQKREKELREAIKRGEAKLIEKLEKRQKEIIDATNWAAKNKNNPEVKRALSDAQKNAPPGVKIVLEEIKDLREVPNHQLLFEKRPGGGTAPQTGGKTLPMGGRLENNGPGLISQDGKTTVALKNNRLILTHNGKEEDITGKLKAVVPNPEKEKITNAVLHKDGNFTLSNKDNKPVYATYTGEKNNDGHKNAPDRVGSSLSVDNDGVVRVTNSGGRPVWSHTEGYGAYKNSVKQPAGNDKDLTTLKTALDAYGKKIGVVLDVDLQTGKAVPVGELEKKLNQHGENVKELGGTDKDRLRLDDEAKKVYDKLDAKQQKLFRQIVYDLTHNVGGVESQDLGSNFSKLSGEAQIEAVTQFGSLEAKQISQEQKEKMMDRMKDAVGAITDNPNAYDGPTQREILRAAQNEKMDMGKFTKFIKDIGAGDYKDPSVRGALITGYTKAKDPEAYIKFINSDTFKNAPPQLQKALAPIAAKYPDKVAKLAGNPTYQKLVADGGFKKMSTEEQVSLSEKFMNDPAVEKTVANILKDPDYKNADKNDEKINERMRDVWRSIDRYAGFDDGYMRTNGNTHNTNETADVDRRTHILTNRVWNEQLKDLLNGKETYNELWDRGFWGDGDLQNLKDSLDDSWWSRG